MSEYLQSDANEPPKSDLMVVRDKNRLEDLMSWTTKKIRVGKQQLLERVAPQKCTRSTDPAFESLNSGFEIEHLAYQRYVSLLNEYSLQVEALVDIEKELCAVFSELVPLEARGIAMTPQTGQKTISEFDQIKSDNAAASQGQSTMYVANLDSTKLNLSDTMNHGLTQRRANAIRAALYVRAIDNANERLSTVTNVAMNDVANSFASANGARVEFDAARNAESSQNSIAVARDRYEHGKQDASMKLELLNAHKIRSVERVLALLNVGSCSFYAAQRDSLCATLRHFSVSVPSDLNTLLSDRSLLSGVSSNASESGAVVNVRSLSRSVSMGTMQVKSYTRRVKNLIAKATPSNQQQQPASK